jgi:hypothetical protein
MLAARGGGLIVDGDVIVVEGEVVDGRAGQGTAVD